MSGRTVDTSVLVPALTAFHEHHDTSRRALRGVDVIPAHVLVETYSVLTRLPGPHRLDPRDARTALSHLPFRSVGLPDEEHPKLVDRLGANGVRGGAVYDALVAATAQLQGLVLVTRDRRASTTYELLGCRYTFA